MAPPRGRGRMSRYSQHWEAANGSGWVSSLRGYCRCERDTRGLKTGESTQSSSQSSHLYLIINPHGVDTLQFACPVLRLLIWDVWKHHTQSRDQNLTHVSESHTVMLVFLCMCPFFNSCCLQTQRGTLKNNSVVRATSWFIHVSLISREQQNENGLSSSAANCWGTKEHQSVQF